MKEAIDSIRNDMEDLVAHREELSGIAQFDRGLAAKLVGLFDAADEVLEYMNDRRG